MRLKWIRLVVLLVLILTLYGGYAYFRMVAGHARLEKATNLLFENPDMTTPARLKQEFLRSAEAVGITIPPEEVILSMEDTDQKSLAGNLIQPSGLFIQSKLLSLDATYTRDFLGFSKRFSINRRKVITYRVEQPMTIPDEIPMD